MSIRPEELTKKMLLDMKFGERISLTNKDGSTSTLKSIYRTFGGWIYLFNDYHAMSSTFVPEELNVNTRVYRSTETGIR